MRKFTQSFFDNDFGINLNPVGPQAFTGSMTSFRSTGLSSGNSGFSVFATPSVLNFAPDALSTATPTVQGRRGNDAPERDIVTEYSIEFIPSDPGFGSQWFMRNTTAGQFDLNVEDVWDDYSGNGVVVTVIDDGFRTTHDDLDGNYLAAQDYDYVNSDFVPVIDSHGTSTIGIIGAEEGNGLGGVGVAFDSDIRGYNGLSFSYFDDQILDAAGLGNGVGNTNGDMFGGDVVSMSFGTSSNVFITGTDITNGVLAMQTASENGRDGLGQIHVKSSGNSRGNLGSTTREEGVGEASDSSKYTISVAALRQDGWVTDFSTPGANVFISAFADNTSNNSSIYTTTSTSDTAFTSFFGGTSAAAPQVAGVVALMLEANADLGWRDVHEILALTSRHTGSDVGTVANSGAPGGGGFEQGTLGATGTWQFNGADGQITWNGGGLHHSNDYGFGMIDALAAIRLAETWDLQQTSQFSTVGTQELSRFENVFFGNQLITTGGIDYTQNVTGTDMIVEYFVLQLDFDTTWLADVEIIVTSPDGTSIQLLDGTGDSGDFDGTWEFGTAGFWGENMVGSWTVNIRDSVSSDALNVQDVDFIFTGKAISGDELFVITNEFSDYDGLFGHSTSFAGGGGVDTLNAAAVTSNSTINLLTGTGTIDGVAITNSNINIVYTGDGSDTIVGDGVSAELYGGRGNDNITSGSAVEEIYGGAGNDTISPGSGDTVYGGDGNDTFSFAPGVYTGMEVRGEGGSNRILVADGPAIVDLSDTGNQFYDIDEIEFLANEIDGKTLIMSAQELDNAVEVSPTLLIDGNASGVNAPDTLQIEFTGTLFAVIDWSGWLFSGWDDTIDVIDINMNAESTTLSATSQADDIDAGAGNDTINGNGGDDLILGGAGDDVLNGDAGNDTINDGGGGDEVYGGAGDDVAIMGDAAINGDSYYGGAGNDTFDASHYSWAVPVTIDLTVGEWSYAAGSEVVDGFENILGADGVGETLIGSSAVNIIEGNGGDDTINAESGADTVNGGAGNDIIIDDDFINFDAHDGGAGVDTIDYSGVSFSEGVVTIDIGAGVTSVDMGNTEAILNFENANGSNGGETIIGSGVANILNGNGGNDDIRGGDGNDTVSGGFGLDRVFGQDGNDVINGDAGDDTLFGGNGADTITGGADDDLIYGQADDDDLFGEGGMDTLVGGAGADQIFGGNDDDFLSGQVGDDFIYGGSGNDSLAGQAGNDTMEGGDGVDSLNAGGGDDELYGGNDNDVINGANGADLAYGGAGSDTITGGGQNDELHGDGGGDSISGNSGNDLIYGGLGNDTLEGQAGADVLYGDNNNDMLFGGGGSDDLYGGAGNDILSGGNGIGNDELWGDSGADIFVMDQGFRVDRIKDFENGIDLIDFSGNGLANNFSDVLADASQVGTTVRIELNANNTVIIENFDLADLDATDFIF